jgi:hypothetical protein
MAGSFEHGNEPSGFIKWGEFFISEHNQFQPRVTDFLNLLCNARVKVTVLLGRYSPQLRRNYAGMNMVYSKAERVFILEHYFVSKSFAAVREAFINAYRN